MTDLTPLSFFLDFKSESLGGLDIPVEVRTADLALVRRTVASKAVEVPPGDYFVTARVPNGFEVTSHVEVMAGTPATASLSLPDAERRRPWQPTATSAIPVDTEPSDIASFEVVAAQAAPPPSIGVDERQPGMLSLAVHRAEQSARRPHADEHVTDGDSVEPNRTALLRLFAGNPLVGPLSPVGEGQIAQAPSAERADAPAVAQQHVGPGEARIAQLSQVLRSREPGTERLVATNLVLPIAPDHSSSIHCTLVLTRGVDGVWQLDAQLEHAVAELMLRYVEEGSLSRAEATLESDTLTAKELLRQKRRDPIAAAAGAYVLLRLNKLNHLHDWTENLMNWFPELPDGAALRAEHLARLGRHEEAFEALIDLQRRGLPIFSDGLSFALDRLRLYVSVGQPTFAAQSLSRASRLLDRLQQVAAYTDFGRSLTVYSGQDPSKPGP